MLTSPGPRRRNAGKALIALTAATALPLTASWATVHVDVPGVAPLAPVGAKPLASAQQVHAAAALTPAASATPAPASAAAPEESVRVNADGTVTLPGGVRLGRDSTAFFANDDVLINGKVKRLEQLTGAERSKLRAIILKSQRELARRRAELPRELAELRREADRARNGDLRQELIRDREDLRRDLAEIASEADELRAEGEDPEKMRAEILRDLREAESIDIDKEIREAIEAADPLKVEAELRRDEQQMERMLARLDELARR